MSVESHGSIMIKTCLLVAVSVLTALVFNAVRPGGIPLVEDWSEKMAARELPQGVEGISFEQALGHFREGKALFVDARDRDFYLLGHIPRALNLPVRAFEQVYEQIRKRLLAHDGPIIIYCEGGHCEMSEELAVRLLMEGITRVKVYRGGIEEWEDKGMPLARGPEPGMPESGQKGS